VISFFSFKAVKIFWLQLGELVSVGFPAMCISCISLMAPQAFTQGG
jgi:hypothetical protein